MNELERTQIVYASIGKAFDYFSDPRNLAALTPAWMRFSVERMPGDEIFNGCEIDYTIRWLRVRIRWTTVITEYERNARFVDEQKRGPYKRWWHEHRFERVSDDITHMTDRVVYDMPLGPLGGAAHALVVRRQLAQILNYRAAVIDRLFPPPLASVVDIDAARADTLSSTP